MKHINKLLLLFLCLLFCVTADAAQLNLKKISKKYDPDDVIHSLILYYPNAPAKKSRTSCRVSL